MQPRDTEKHLSFSNWSWSHTRLKTTTTTKQDSRQRAPSLWGLMCSCHAQMKRLVPAEAHRGASATRPDSFLTQSIRCSQSADATHAAAHAQWSNVISAPP